MTQPEHIIQNKIRLALSANQCTVFRINVGKVRLPNGRYFTTGVPDGYSDLSGFKWSNGKAFFIEVKKEVFEAYSRNKLAIEHHLNDNAIIESVGWGK